MLRLFFLLPVSLILVNGSPALSHGGGLDSEGCHTNARKKDKHCHRRDKVKEKPNASFASLPFVVSLLSVGDGDTVRVSSSKGKKITVRFACIDAPEKSQGVSGKWATQLLKQLILRQPISLKPQVVDRYGRLVAEIYRGSININLRMVELGGAYVYRDYLAQCERDAYLSAEASAMSLKLGVWGPYRVDQQPWIYRRFRSNN